MKKLFALLLLAALLIPLAACSAERDASGTSNNATMSGNNIPEPSDDTLLFDEDYQIDLSKYVTVPELPTLSQEELTENLNQTLNQILQYNADYEATDADYAAALGDTVNIHYKGYAANESDNITADTLANMSNISYDGDGNLTAGYDLVLGSGTMIGAYESEEHPEKNHPGFEEQLVGMKAGETRTITVTFSDNYRNSAELRGMEIKFDVTANSVKKSIVPEELTDEMVSDYTGGEFETVAAFEEYVLEYYRGQMAYAQLWKTATILSYPAELLDSEIAAYIADYIEQVYGTDLSDEEAKTIFDEQYDVAASQAESIVKDYMILEVLLDRYDITLTYGVYKEKRQELFELESYTAMIYGITSAEEFEEYFGRDTLIREFQYDLLTDVLAEVAQFE